MKGLDTMVKTVLNAMGVDPAMFTQTLTEVRGHMLGAASNMRHIFDGNQRIERRLARLEAHFGLSDIEPVPTVVTEITHVEIKPTLVIGPAADGR